MIELIDLPDVVIVHVLTFLKSNDRFNTSLTCKSLNSRFNHPSLWRCMKIEISGNYHEDEGRVMRKNQPRSESIIEAKRIEDKLCCVGGYVQELELIFQCCSKPIDERSQSLIHLFISNASRLKSLTLSMYPCQQGTGRVAHSEDLQAVSAILNSCDKLNSFTLRFWPSSAGQGYHIFEKLVSNENLISSVENLNLFWPDRDSSSWAAIRASETPASIVEIIDQFKNLTHFSLPSNLLSGELLRELVKMPRKRLQSLRILVTYSRQESSAIPQISAVRWKDFSSYHSDVSIEVVFSNRVPSPDMAAILNIEMPVSSLYFMPYSRCSKTDIVDFAMKFSGSLKRYVNLSNETIDADESLLNLVNLCNHLHTFVHYSKLNWKTVIDLAKSKSENWFRFEISEEAINFRDDMADENEVIRKVDDQYRLVGVEKWGVHDDDVIKHSTMTDSVSVALKQRWKPTNRH